MLHRYTTKTLAVLCWCTIKRLCGFCKCTLKGLVYHEGILLFTDVPWRGCLFSTGVQWKVCLLYTGVPWWNCLVCTGLPWRNSAAEWELCQGSSLQWGQDVCGTVQWPDAVLWQGQRVMTCLALTMYTNMLWLCIPILVECKLLNQTS